MDVHNQALAAQSGLADWQSEWIPVAAANFRRASFTLAWTLVAATSGTLAFEGTDDPAKAAANVVTLTIATSHGTYPTVGAAAANALVVLDNCPGYVRVKYTRAAGGGAGQFSGFVTRSQ